jgi:uncharacterized protein YndB with AHSA1/START domain
VDAAPKAVWERLSDIAGMESWSGLPVRMETPGPVEVGTRRRLRMFGGWVTEEIVAWDPPRGYAYRLTSGAPLTHHRGEVSITADGGGSRVRWAVRFRSRLPLTGPLIAAVLQRRIARALTGLPGALPHDPQKDRRYP